MATGAVKWFNATKGFGFITPDLGPCDVFVHISALTASGIGSLQPGDRLEFEMTQGGDGRLLALGLRRPLAERQPSPDPATESRAPA